jgi:hypothetical protein
MKIKLNGRKVGNGNISNAKGLSQLCCELYCGIRLVEAVNLILSNPVVIGLLTGVASNAVYDTVKAITKHLICHFKEKPELFTTEDVKKTEEQVAVFFEKYNQGIWNTVQGVFWEQLRQFLFQNQRIDFATLDEQRRQYVSERLFYGISFQSMLVELGCKRENVKYMFPFPAARLDSPHYFDVKAKNAFQCVDQLVVARVVDNRAMDPIVPLQAIPVIIDEINNANPAAHFRDFDLYVIIHSGQYDPEINTRVKGIIKNYETNQPDMPRFVYFEKQDLDGLMTAKKEERVLSLRQKFADMKVDRRV